MGLRGRPAVIAAALAVWLSVAISGCALTEAVLLPTPEPIAEEHMPMWAGVTVVGDPAVAERPVKLELLALPDTIVFATIEIPAGTLIRWANGAGEGPIRILGDEGSCTIDIDLPPEQTTFVEFLHDATTCGFVITEDVLPVDSGQVSVQVLAQPWNELTVEAVSLDTPAQPVPSGVPPDEGGLAQIYPLYTGRYEIRLRRGDEYLERQEITIESRGDAGHLITLEFDGVPD
jgi:hypothetical protein